MKGQVIARTGHYYYQDKDDLLWERVRRRMAAVRASSLDAYLDRLAEGDSGEEEWQSLEIELTIGETYFFRYSEQFAALRETIVPSLIRNRANDRQLRIWSAGCSTGAEPYSIAILLHDLLGDRIDDWRISIVGTDINEAFLSQAREAQFGAWSLRTLSQAQKREWFTGDGKTWLLKPQFRRLVRFQRANLLDLLGPAPPLEFADFDLILCRNVLIYFHPRMVATIAGALVDRLRPRGWLLVGHAEPNPDFDTIADAVSLPGTVAYRPLGVGAANKSAAARTDPVWEPIPPPLQRTLPEPQTPLIPPAAFAKERSKVEPKPDGEIRSRAPDAASAADLLDEVRRLADFGDFSGAELSCRDALAKWPDEPALHFYSGLIEQALGKLGRAEDGFRRAAYLAPEFIMAQYHLGLVRMERGRRDAGRRAVAAAAQMAGTLAVDARLPEGAGLTAGDLREMARVLLDSGA